MFSKDIDDMFSKNIAHKGTLAKCHHCYPLEFLGTGIELSMTTHINPKDLCSLARDKGPLTEGRKPGRPLGPPTDGPGGTRGY
jgi:hypothetical protein